MRTFLTTFRQSFRRTDTTRTGAESLAAAGPNASTGIVETDDNKPAVDERLIADSAAAEVAAYTEDADRTADQLVALVQREMTLANTPLWFQYPDAGYGDDDFAEDHSEEAVDRLEEHLRSHAELRTMPKWASDYAALDAEAGSVSPFDVWIPLSPDPPEAALDEPQDCPPGHPDYIAEPECYPPGHPDHVFASQEAEDRFWDTWEADQDARAARETEAASRAVVDVTDDADRYPA